MSAPRLEDVIAQELGWSRPEFEPSYEDWARRVSAVWREVCTIRTVEQLDALPDEAIVRGGGESFEGNVFKRYGDWPDDGGSRWLVMGTDPTDTADSVHLPAMLLWHPDWEAS